MTISISLDHATCGMLYSSYAGAYHQSLIRRDAAVRDPLTNDRAQKRSDVAPRIRRLSPKMTIVPGRTLWRSFEHLMQRKSVARCPDSIDWCSVARCGARPGFRLACRCVSMGASGWRDICGAGTLGLTSNDNCCPCIHQSGAGATLDERATRDRLASSALDDRVPSIRCTTKSSRPHGWTTTGPPTRLKWATEIVFETPAALAEVYQALVQHAMHHFESPSVMRLLGKKPTATSSANGQPVSRTGPKAFA